MGSGWESKHRYLTRGLYIHEDHAGTVLRNPIPPHHSRGSKQRDIRNAVLGTKKYSDFSTKG